MTRFMLRLTVGIALGCTLGSLIALAIGNTLPSDDELVFAANVDNRDFEIYRMSLSRGMMAALTHNDRDDVQPTWSPDGQQIAFVSSFEQQNHIYIMNMNGGEVRRLIDSEFSEFNPAWSPDGQQMTYERLIYMFSSVLMMTSLPTNETLFLTDGDSGSNTSTWSPDGQRVAFAADPNELGIQNIYTVDIHNRAMNTLIRSEKNLGRPAWSPDGRYVSYISGVPGNQELILWDTNASQAIPLGISARFISTAAEWSPDSRYLMITLPVDTLTNNSFDTAFFKLDIVLCLRNKAACTPQRLTHKQGHFLNPNWRPTSP